MVFGKRLRSIGVAESEVKLFCDRELWSSDQIAKLSEALDGASALLSYPGLCIYSAGSYGRGEGTRYSDIDLFFLHFDHSNFVEDPNLKGIRVLSTVMKSMEAEMEFPPPSNDGQFFRILPLSGMLEQLGAAEDDYRNYFTARMLMLLESTPVFGGQVYQACLGELLDSYLRDYEDHAESFRPTFLVNDILRFWKTLCLNYEHKRNQSNERNKIKQKIKNYKLKFSRLMTCFASVAVLASLKQVSKEELIQLCCKSPVNRLVDLSGAFPHEKVRIVEVLRLYAEFLRSVDCPTAELEATFSVKDNRIAAFKRADDFGAAMFGLVRAVADRNDTLRYLVI